MFRTVGLGFTCLFTLSACDAGSTGTEPAPGSVQTDVDNAPIAAGLTGQSYSVSEELFGYFMPYEDISVGSINLNHISLAIGWEVEAYINGEADAWPPVHLNFDDTASPAGVNELGGTYYEVSYRVSPEIFRISDEGIAFIGQHELLGEIRFEGDWQMDQVRQMMSGDPSSTSALTGDLKIGDVIYEDVTFQGWLGD